MTKTATPALVTLLNSGGPLVYADLYTITLLGGGILRYTGADKLMSWGGHAFLVGPIIKRGRTRTQVGVTVDSLEITLSAAETVQVNSKPLMGFLAVGGLDGARMRLERAFMPSWAVDPVGTLYMFSGRVNDVSMGRYEARISVQSDLELLDARVPRNIYQPGCVNTLYDGACNINRAIHTVAGAVTGAITPSRSRFSTGLLQSSEYFALGALTFTSGVNSGVARTIRSYVDGTIGTIAPFPFPPAVGDSFNVVPGCDGTTAVCVGRFNNLPRFRGQPFIPKPETVT